MTQGATGSVLKGRPAGDRFWSRVDKREPDECWRWTGALSARGYGDLTVNGKRVRATQFSLELAGKPRPSAKHFACHACDNPACVNPAHLWWGTQKDNLHDASVKGRIYGSTLTHCKNGHPFSGDNVVKRSDNGGRACRACRRARFHRAKAREALKAAGVEL